MSIANSSMLVNITLSVWSGRKLDRKVSEEVDVAKSTRTRAGNYNKNLFAGVTELESIARKGGQIRNWHHEQTSPWADSGERLLTMANFMDYKKQLGVFKIEFVDLVAIFEAKYANIISTQAFTMGTLFDRDDYPDASEIASKFKMGYTFSPVPDVGDWRVTTDAETKRELDEEYKKVYEDRLNNVTKDLWGRLHTCLTHMTERMTDTAAGEKKIFRDSLLDNAVELCGLLTKLNITNDPKLEEARKLLESTVCNVDVQDLRTSTGARLEIKAQVDEILNKFNW